MTERITRENIQMLIANGVVYRSDTPSGWATLRVPADAPAGAQDDPWAFVQIVDVPEVQHILDDLSARSAAAADRFQAEFAALIAGLVRIHEANFLSAEVRQQHNLSELLADRTPILVSEDGCGLWYHGRTVVVRQQTTGRLTVQYGGSFDIYVSPDDPAAHLAR